MTPESVQVVPAADPRSFVDAMSRTMHGRTHCLVCGAPLGEQLRHVGKPTLLGRIAVATWRKHANNP